MEPAGRSERSRRVGIAMLWSGQLVSSLGDAVYRIALAFLLLERTGSTAVTGAVLAASMLPKILLSPVAGAAADAVSRKRILVAADVLCAAAALSLGAAAVFGEAELWMIVAAALAIESGVAFFNTAQETVLPDLVSRASLSRANAAFSFAMTGAALLGNSLGGFAFRALGAPILFLVDGLTFLFSAACSAAASLPRRDGRAGGRPDFARRVRRGIGIVRGAEGMSGLLVVSSTANLLLAAALFCVLAMCEGRAALGPAAYGLLMAAFSAGAMAGYTAAASRAIPATRRFALFTAAGVATGAALAGLPAPTTVIGMLPLLFAAGLAVSVNGTLATTALQLAVGSEDRGAVLGLRAAVMTAMPPIGVAAAGWLCEVASPEAVLCVSGAALAGVYTAASPSRGVREILKGGNAGS